MLPVFVMLSLLLTGAIFGFFYAWVSSTMWGLDAIDAGTAIAAMQGMNASVRNWVFFPAFFLTPVVLAVTALIARPVSRPAFGLFLAAALVYAVGGLALTMLVNVPMNETLAAAGHPASPEQAAEIWDAYSGRWQLWNQVRTVASGLALLLAGWGAWRAAEAVGRGTRRV